MGLIRKTASLSTLGVVDYRSKRETQKRAANADANLAKQEAKLVKAQRIALERENRAAEAEQRQQAAHGQPWYSQPTVGGLIKAYREGKKADDHRQKQESMTASGDDEA